MWHWDQGRLEYFQFGVLRKVAQFVIQHDLKSASRDFLSAQTGVPFSAPDTHSPWRNYARIYKSCFLVSERNHTAMPTPVARMLATPGFVTSDEYFHFLVSASTEPSPALKDWNPNLTFRYPLLVSLKYLLAKIAVKNEPVASLLELMGFYNATSFCGDEDQNTYSHALLEPPTYYENIGKNTPDNLKRQARESLRVIAQISYLHVQRDNMVVSLAQQDAADIFTDLYPVGGPYAADRESEIERVALCFQDGRTYKFFDYPNASINETVESGFVEGGKVKRTHISIERNSGLRVEFFKTHPTAVCDVCGLDTASTYPWTERVIDLHHILPLAAGTRVESQGTVLTDLVPICPTCHRAVHSYYDVWLRNNNRADFNDSNEARLVYQEIKNRFQRLIP